jgi:hypothetical protein
MTPMKSIRLAKLLLVGALGVIAVCTACNSSTTGASTRKPLSATSTPAKPWDYTVKATDSGAPIVLLSKEEVRDMQTHATTLAQVAGLAPMPTYHGVANLSSGTHLRQTDKRTYTLDLASPTYVTSHLNSYAVRVVDGPANWLEGRIAATGIN